MSYNRWSVLGLGLWVPLILSVNSNREAQPQCLPAEGSLRPSEALSTCVGQVEAVFDTLSIQPKNVLGCPNVTGNFQCSLNKPGASISGSGNDQPMTLSLKLRESKANPEDSVILQMNMSSPETLGLELSSYRIELDEEDACSSKTLKFKRPGHSLSEDQKDSILFVYSRSQPNFLGIRGYSTDGNPRTLECQRTQSKPAASFSQMFRKMDLDRAQVSTYKPPLNPQNCPAELQNLAPWKTQFTEWSKDPSVSAESRAMFDYALKNHMNPDSPDFKDIFVPLCDSTSKARSFLFLPPDAFASEVLQINGLYSSPDSLRQGAGRAALVEAIRRCLLAPLCKSLQVDPYGSSENFYSKMGFTLVQNEEGSEAYLDMTDILVGFPEFEKMMQTRRTHFILAPEKRRLETPADDAAPKKRALGK